MKLIILPPPPDKETPPRCCRVGPGLVSMIADTLECIAAPQIGNTIC